MKTQSCIFTLVILLLVSCNLNQNKELNTDYSLLVNPFIGTDFTGNTYPGAQMPFGMVQLSPDNGLPGWDRIAGYYYPDSTIAGFSHTHLSGTGAGDLYDISFMPVTLPYNKVDAPLGIHSKFTHDNETAHAGYYQVYLNDYDINVELTATDRCGIQRYTFPEAQSAVLLDLNKAMNWDATIDTKIEIIDSVTIGGYRYSTGWANDQRLYFYTRFSRPFASYQLDSIPLFKNGKKDGMGMIAQFNFPTKTNDQLTISTALSAVSMEGAKNNLMAEVTDDSFDRYTALAKNKWNKHLSVIEVDGNNQDDLVNFYTALYRSMLAPTLYNDVDGQYRGADKQIHQADGWNNYSTFSLWDTYRAAHPLFTYTQPERVNDMVKSFLAFYEQNGRLPVWNFQGCETDMMIGYHAVPVIADAYLKGIGDFDARKALEACVATANIDEYRGLKEYKQLGYVPFDLNDPYNAENWSLSKTMEYAFDDYCIAQMAQSLGEEEIANTFYNRAQHYKNIYNPVSTFMQPRDSKGAFQSNFNAEDYTEHICESNAWQYFWSVQHDAEGLIDLVGGKDRFKQKLDSMFTFNPSADADLPIFSTGMIGQYVHGNEPSHHVIYLYNKIGYPEMTQYYAAKVMNELYRNEPAGLCGNEDCGQMSAWYVFSAMGFYPLNPVDGTYEIGTPLFKNVKLNLNNGKTFSITAHNLNKENIYIQSIKLDGEPYTHTYLTHQQIMDGAHFEFEMSNTPKSIYNKD